MSSPLSFVSGVRHLRNLHTSSGKNQRVNHLAATWHLS